MVKILIEAEGLKEAIAKMDSAKEDIPQALMLGMYEALEPVKQDTTSYPAQQSHINPRYTYIRGVGTQYITTGGVPGRIYRTSQHYGQTQTITVEKNGSSIEGSLNTGASYWRYLRGDLEGYEGAWMHRAIWTPISTIVNRHMARIAELLETRIVQWFNQR